MLEKVFKLRENHTTVKTEILAGITTFMTMAYILAVNPNIYERVWNEKAVNSDTIMVHVRNNREKIDINPKNPKYLKVVWGVGYKMEKQ